MWVLLYYRYSQNKKIEGFHERDTKLVWSPNKSSLFENIFIFHNHNPLFWIYHMNRVLTLNFNVSPSAKIHPPDHSAVHPKMTGYNVSNHLLPQAPRRGEEAGELPPLVPPQAASPNLRGECSQAQPGEWSNTQAQKKQSTYLSPTPGLNPGTSEIHWAWSRALAPDITLFRRGEGYRGAVRWFLSNG